MKFLVDAQLPLGLARWLGQSGHDAIHTLDLPLGNRTSDGEIVAAAVREERVVITKDSDFVRTYLITGQPRLLLMSTGNISNTELDRLLRGNWPAIENAFDTCDFVELGRSALLIHD